MARPTKPRNNIVEFFRFIYSLLVVGYHVQMTYEDDVYDFFENGAIAVEYFFLLSGYFLARSLEKLAKDEKTNFFLKIYYFMKNKITALLNVHVLAIIAIIIVIACCDTKSFADKFVPGIPSIFLVHMIIVWSADFDKALIVPEWYISSMLICMLFMVFFYLLFCKILKGIYATLILLGILCIIALITGLATSWKFNQNMVYNIRAWSEMCIGMLSYYVSIAIKDKTYSDCIIIILKIVEMIGYVVPAIIGIIPYNLDFKTYAVGVIFIFVGVFITFAEKGNIVKNEKVNFVFGYLGAISLPIYLFHPVIISLIDYLKKDMPKYAKHLIVFPSSLVLAFLYRFIANWLNKLMAEREKEKKKLEEEKKEAEKEKEKEVVILNEEGQRENQNIVNNENNQINLQPSSDK